MDTPTQDIPKVEAIYTTEDIIKQVESSGINLGDDPVKRVNTFIAHGLLPQPKNGRFASWVVQRVIAIQNQLMEGKSITELEAEVKKERRRFLNQVTDLNSMVKLYQKFSSNSMFMLASSLLLIFISLGFVANMLAPGNPVIVAGKNTVKKAVETGGDIAKRAVSPVGKTLVMIIKTSKPEGSTSADPLGLTNLEVATPVIPENLVQLDGLGNLIIKGEVAAISFSGSGETLTNLPWTALSGRPKVLSAIDGVSSDEGEIDLVAGTGILILPDDTLDTITISGLDGGSFQAIFKNIAVSGQTTIASNINADTLTFAAGSNVSLTTNALTDTLTIGVTGTVSNADTLDLLDSSQFLRSDVADSFTAGTLTFNAGTTLSILGSFSCTNCVGDAAIPNTITASNYLPLAGGTMAGNIDLNTNLLLNIGNAGTDFTASGSLNIADDLDVEGHGAFGVNADVTSVSGTRSTLYLDDVNSGSISYGVRLELEGTGPVAQYGIWSEVTNSSISVTSAILESAYLNTVYNSSRNLTNIRGIEITLSSSLSGVGALTDARGLSIGGSWSGSSPVNTTGIYLGDLTGANTTGYAYGILIGDLTNGTNRYPIYQVGINGSNIFNANSVFGRTPSGNDTLYGVVIQGALCVDDGTANCPAGPTSGAIYVENSVGAGNVSAFDISEYYPAVEPTEKGDIVSAAGNSAVKKSSSSYDPTVIGIVATDPAMVIDETSIMFGKGAGDKFNPLKPYIALAGRVPTKVSTENGDIEPGDPLTSSSTPGVAMKATKSGPIIGKALEAYGGSGVGKIMVFVTTSWYVAGLDAGSSISDLSNITNLNVENLTSNIVNAQILFIGSTKISMAKNGGLKIDGDVEVNGNLIAKRVTTDELVVSTKTSGLDIIKAGQKEVTVENDKVKETSKVLVTFADDYSPATRFWITKKAGESFTVHLDQATVSNVSFDWLIIN